MELHRGPNPCPPSMDWAFSVWTCFMLFHAHGPSSQELRVGSVAPPRLLSSQPPCELGEAERWGLRSPGKLPGLDPAAPALGPRPPPALAELSLETAAPSARGAGCACEKMPTAAFLFSLLPQTRGCGTCSRGTSPAAPPPTPSGWTGSSRASATNSAWWR